MAAEGFNGLKMLLAQMQPDDGPAVGSEWAVGSTVFEMWLGAL